VVPTEAGCRVRDGWLGLRTLAIAAGVGFLTVLLAGPALGLLSILFALLCTLLSVAIGLFAVLLSFAVLGFVVWAPIRLLCGGPKSAWRDVAAKANGFFFAFSIIRSHMLQLAGYGWTRGTTFWTSAWNRARLRLELVAELVIDAVSGCLVGAMLVWVCEGQWLSIVLGSVLGAYLGFLVGVCRTRSLPDEAV
jgi:hypothetical protein